MEQITDQQSLDNEEELIPSTDLPGSPRRIEVDFSEWVQIRCEAKYWKTHFSKVKVREERLKAQVKELKRVHGAELRLKRKVDRLQGLLAQASGVDGQYNLLARQRDKIRELTDLVEQLRKDKCALQQKVQCLDKRCEELDCQLAVFQRMTFGERSERQADGTQSDSDSVVRESRKTKRKKPSKPVVRTRHDYSDLPAVEEQLAVEGECARCGKPYVSNGHEQSELLEIEVKAHRRVIRRQRKRSSCDCDVSGEVVAASAPRLFPNTRYGTSFWSFYLFQRFVMHQTVGDFCRFSESFGVKLTKSTLIHHNESFVSLFGDFYHAIRAHQSDSLLVHGDETSWPMQMAGICDGEHYRAWLWVCVSSDAVSCHIDRHRSAEAAKVVFSHLGEGDEQLVLVCDRYRAYQKLSKDLDCQLAYCWVHVRRDYIKVAEGRPRLTAWKKRWLELFGEIFAANKKRLAQYDSQLPMMRQSSAFQQRQAQLEDLVERFFRQAETELKALSADSVKARPLKSLLRHRQGLSVFVSRPEVPMDNNLAERMIRPMVIARKPTQGSKSESGALLRAVLLTIFETLRMNEVRVYDWLMEYLGACAATGGKAPSDLSNWLPWQMDQQRLKRFKQASVARPQAP